RAGAPPARDYVRVLRHMLARNPPPRSVAGWPPHLGALAQALPEVYAELRAADARSELGGGWTTAVNVRTHFGRDFLTRARVARNWIGTLGIEEAMYVMAEVDAQGRVLDGGERYTLRFPGAGMPEVDTFW